MKRAYNLIIGERMAEEIKIKIGSAYPLDQELNYEIRGRDAMTSLPLYTAHHLAGSPRVPDLKNFNAIIDA